ncbi:MAG: hypothetical protein AAF311_01930 [Pseudomonadota bacterium]
MSHRLSILLFTAALSACAGGSIDPADTSQAETGTAEVQAVASESQAVSIPVLTEDWVLDGLDAPESVIPTLAGDGYYVSNVGGEGTDRDNDGAISRIGLDGTMIERDWITGTDAVPLHAPKGMTVMRSGKGDALLVTDIDHVAFILAAEGRLAKRLPAPGAGFLNDIAKGPGESAFISDSANARIYRLENDEITVWLEDDRLRGVNGLMMDKGRLLVTTMSAGELLSIDPETQEITVLAGGMESADGIGVRADGSYMVSSWPGRLWHVREGEAPTLLQDTSGEDGAIYMNDVLFLEDRAIAPNWMPGTVRAYHIE